MVKNKEKLYDKYEKMQKLAIEKCNKEKINIRVPEKDYLSKEEEKYYIKECNKYLKRDEKYENKHLPQ